MARSRPAAALESHASCLYEGCTEAVMLAHGFTAAQMVALEANGQRGTVCAEN
jgi:hypothetical protein